MDVDGFDPSQSFIRSYDTEHALWEETIARAVDDTECSIELNGLGLTYIPPKISDLSLRFVLPNQTSSNREDMRRRTISKSSSSIVFGGSNLGVRENEFQLYITNNRIRTLPNELFNLDALVVLSLRSNMLTELNPQICQLHNLRELNVASNQLRYLPSEIMDMKLTSLAVDPNPFAVNPCAAAGLSIDRWFGPVERRHRVVPLVELALRVLLAPVPDSNGTRNLMPPTTRRIQPKTVLQSFYDLPLPTDYEISPALRETLSSCVPGSIASLLSLNATPQSSPEGQRPSQRVERRACISGCPSPAHLLLGSGEQYREPIYVSHAEERLSWEKEIAGQKVGGELGIPVRWRGCSAGCLDHLEQPVDAGAGQGEEGWLTTEMEVDTGLLHSEFIPVVEQFTSDGFEFDLSD
ncbi:hypothetical protein DFH11DRAFT_1579933 [Phellopilus nigrolimitatus]|nr:hypothetical protein DFH11DRAFT_1579933 [Phellopilus nigrolimitatus]